MLLKKNQSGFSLLILLIVLMGFGGFALANYSQNIFKQVEKSRFEHNQEVLLQAKQALLMYAYNYPQTHDGRGPGHLPCPDHDNDGQIDNPLVCHKVGRFPWRSPDLNIFDTEDSSGENLWYAVSSSFDNFFGGGIINSDTLGTITIFDQTGKLIYDGSVSGVAAVIIAPGTPINGQDRSIANGDDPDDGNPDSDPGIVDPANYLDVFNTFDNSTFVNSSSANNDDGFRLGPVYDPAQQSYVMNDQMIIVTADEVIAMAEKATLDAYQQSIREYLTNTGNIYPWLFDYNVDDLDIYSAAATNMTVHPVGALTNIGRIPTIFARYFEDNDSDKFDSEVLIGVSKGFDVTGSSYTLDLIAASSTVMTEVEFQDDGAANDDVKFSALANPEVLQTKELYFYDASPPTRLWQPCPGPAPADQISDCNMTGLGAFTSGPNTFSSEILIVGVSVDFSNDIEIKLDTTPEPTLTYDAATLAYDHARVNANFLPAAFSDNAELPAEVYYRIGDYPSGGAFTETASGSQPLLDNLSFAGPGITNQTAGNVTLGVRYYPVLPSWAKSNNWHNSIMMAIAPDYQPGGANDCVVNPPCLTVGDMGGDNDDKVSLLTMAGSAAVLVDDEVPADGFMDELVDIFDAENANRDNVFLRRQGDDTVLVIK